MTTAGGSRRAVKLALLVVFGAAVIAFLALDFRYLTLDTIQENRDQLRGFVQAHYAVALVVAFAVYASATSLSLPTGTVLSLTFGFLFGRWVASALIVTAGTLGATLLFVIARYLFGGAARERLGALGARINAEFRDDGFYWLLFLRLMPLVPYFLVNLAPAITEIRVRTYVLATFIGILPSTLIVTNVGQALDTIVSTRSLLTPEALVALSLLGVLALLPVLVHHLRSRTR